MRVCQALRLAGAARCDLFDCMRTRCSKAKCGAKRHIAAVDALHLHRAPIVLPCEGGMGVRCPIDCRPVLVQKKDMPTPLEKPIALPSELFELVYICTPIVKDVK